MAGSKLSLVKEATQFMVQQMSSVDRLSVVSFDDKVKDVYGGSGDMHFMTSGNKKVVAAAINRIQSGGGTNLSAGLFRGIDHHQQSATLPSQAQPDGSAERVRSVFLFTDGHSTAGLTDIHQITPILSAMLSNSISPKVFTFGFGSNLDDAVLNAISEEGNGQSTYMEDAESIPGSFANALGGLMSMAAQNLELTFIPREGVSVCRIKTSFKQTTQADGSIRVAVGDLFADEQKDFLLELDIPGVSVTDVTQQVMHVQARYLDISNTCMRDDSFAVTTARTADTAGLRHSHPIVLEHVQRIEASNALQAAALLADQGDLPSARAVLHQSIDGVSRGPISAGSTRLVADLSTTLEAFEDELTYQHQGRSMSSRFGREHARQQASVMSRGRESAYATQAQLRMSRMTQGRADSSAASGAHVHPPQAHLVAQPANVTVHCDTTLEVAVPQQMSHQRQGAGSRHGSTATIAYAAGPGRSSGCKRPHDQTGGASNCEARSSLLQEGGYNTRAKHRRASEA